MAPEFLLPAELLQGVFRVGSLASPLLVLFFFATILSFLWSKRGEGRRSGAPPTPGSTHNQTVPHVPPGAIDMEAFRRELEATRKEVQLVGDTFFEKRNLNI